MGAPSIQRGRGRLVWLPERERIGEVAESPVDVEPALILELGDHAPRRSAVHAEIGGDRFPGPRASAGIVDVKGDGDPDELGGPGNPVGADLEQEPDPLVAIFEFRYGMYATLDRRRGRVYIYMLVICAGLLSRQMASPE
jgi:hypothetical protein